MLTMSCANLPAGAVIYYTLDGTDPRLLGGALNTASDVFQYAGSLTLTQGEEVRARVYSGGTWSAISEADFVPNLSSLRVTEVMYDPAPATAAEIAAGYVVSDTSDPNKDFQFIEIENTGTQTLPLGGLQISGGIDFTFPQYEGNVSTNPLLTLAPNSYVVAVADPSAFSDPLRRGAASPIRQQLAEPGRRRPVQPTITSSNSSDEIELSSSNGGVIQDFTYQSSWYPQTARGRFFPHRPQCHAGHCRSGTPAPAGSPAGRPTARRARPKRRPSPCPARWSSTKSWPTRPRPAAT